MHGAYLKHASTSVCDLVSSVKGKHLVHKFQSLLKFANLSMQPIDYIVKPLGLLYHL